MWSRGQDLLVTSGGGEAGRQRGATTMAGNWCRRQFQCLGQNQLSGPCQLAFVAGLFVLLLPLSILDEESRESTPPLPATEEDDMKEVTRSSPTHSAMSDIKVNWILNNVIFFRYPSFWKLQIVLEQICFFSVSFSTCYRRLIYPTQAPLVSLRKIFCGKGSSTPNLLANRCE